MQDSNYKKIKAKQVEKKIKKKINSTKILVKHQITSSRLIVYH